MTHATTHEKDETHWLYRLTADEWLRAAATELRHSRQAFENKSQRAAVAHARRAGGMAINALLWLAFRRFLRTQLRAGPLGRFAKDPAVPSSLQVDAQELLAMPMQAVLVQLGPKGDPKQADPAARILEWAQKLAQSHQTEIDRAGRLFTPSSAVVFRKTRAHLRQHRQSC